MEKNKTFNIMSNLHKLYLPGFKILRFVFYKISPIVYKKPMLFLLCVWILVQLLAYLNFGIVTNKEAVKYIDEAKYFLNDGHFSEPKYLFYSSYIFLHIIFAWLGFEVTGVYFIQLFMNLLALYLLYKTALKVWENKAIAFITVLLLLLCYPWQYWTVFLYTESFFCCLLIIFTYLVFGTTKRTNARVTLTVIVLILLLFARPTGILLMPVTAMLLIYYLINQKRTVTALVAGVLLLFAFISIVNFTMKGSPSYDFMKPLQENNVLCYIPDSALHKQTISAGENNSLLAIINYILEHPLLFLKLSVLKFLSFWGMVRSYYSAFHNICLMCFFYPLYIFAIVGLWSLKRGQKYFVLYIMAMLSIFTLSVMLTCDDWNNRFVLPVLPFVMMFAANGIYHFYKRFVQVKSPAVKET